MPLPDPNPDILQLARDPARVARWRRRAEKMIEAHAQAGLDAELRTLTPTQAAEWIENNVTNLATAKTALKIMARILVAMRDQIYPDISE